MVKHGEFSAFPREGGRQVHRHITDKKWLWAFLLYVAFMVSIVIVGFYYGNPGRLSHGVDYAGQVCGVDESVRDNKFAYWCGTKDWHGDWPLALNDNSIVCVSSCPKNSSEKIACLMPAVKKFTGIPASVQPLTENGNRNVETLQMHVTQSIIYQQAYPTEAFAGKFCLPTLDNQGLRDNLIKGPWAAKFKWYGMVASVEATGLVVLISALLALLLGMLYLRGLKSFAGPVMFGSMVMSTIICLVIGIIYGWAVFIGDSDGTSFYARNNPLYRMYTTGEARLYSCTIGFIFLLLGCCLGCMTSRSMTHIDEMVGIVDATCECIWATPAMWTWPFFQTLFYFGLWILFIIFGLPYVASLGQLETEQIIINDQPVTGLWTRYDRKEWQIYGILFYLFGCIWVIEVYVQFGHFVVSYAVAMWYFAPGTENPVPPGKSLDGLMGKLSANAGKDDGLITKAPTKMQNIRVAGADANYGRRDATRVSTEAGDFILVNVQKKGPGLGRNDMVLMKYTKDQNSLPGAFVTMRGALVCLTHHLGSLALGSFPIFAFRPLRIFGDCISAQLSRQGENPMRSAGMSEARSLEVAGCCKIFTQFLDQAVGKWNKMAYMQQVLGGGHSELHVHGHEPQNPDCCCCPTSPICCIICRTCCDLGGGGHHHGAIEGFWAAAEVAFTMVVGAAGSLSYLHGACFIYEAFGTLFITLCCTSVNLILLNSLNVFNDPNSDWYVEDKITATIVAAISAGCVAFSCMSTFNHTADCLLYCVGWNRKQVKQMMPIESDKRVIEQMQIKQFCPQNLRNLLPPYELDVSYEDGLENKLSHKQTAARQFDALWKSMGSGMQSMRSGGQSTQYGPAYGPGYQQTTTGAIGDHVLATIQYHTGGT